MSTGSILGGIVGAVIGYFAGGNVAYGWAIGSAIGGAIDPDQIDGPHLNDRSIQVSTQGVSIPILYGGVAGTGNVIWATDLVEHDVGGKGGPTVTNHTYSISCAILLGEPPIGQTIGGIRRMWADSKLVYDVSEGAATATQAASVIFSSYFTFYDGSTTQLPDPTMEAALGAGNVSAYRGCAYVVFRDLPLQDYGNRLPIFRFETADSIDSEVADGEVTYEPLTIRPWSGEPPSTGDGYTQYTVNEVVGGTTFAGALASLQSVFGAHYGTYVGFTTNLNGILSSFAGGGYHAADETLNANGGAQFANSAFNYEVGKIILDHLPIGTSDQEYCAPLPCYVAGGPTDAYMALSFPQAVGSGASTSSSTGVARMFSGELPAPYPYNQAGGFGANCISCAPSPLGYFPIARGIRNRFITAERLPQPPDGNPGCRVGDPCLLVVAQVPGHPEYCINCAGEITPNTAVTYEVITGTFKQLGAIKYRDGVLYQNGLGPVLLPSDPDFDNPAFWAAAAAPRLLDGTLRSDLTYPVVVTKVARGTKGAVTRLVGAEANTTLDAIVADVCKRSGMAEPLFDVSALEGIVVQGYDISREMPGRAALGPLQQAFWWDFVESERKLKAVLRGADAIASIDLDDLGATEGDESPVAIISNRGQESELPATVEVSYASRANGYETSTQRARRTTTKSTQKVNIEMPVVVPDQRAVDIANVVMYENWTARTTREWSTTRKFTRYEPTDVWELNDGEFSHVVRVTEKSEAGPVINWKGVDNRPASYRPKATPASSAVGIGGVRFDGPMKLELIDSPILLDTNDDPGLYAAAAGYMPSWPSGSAFKSMDAGASYQLVKAMNNKAAMGYAVNALGSWSGGNMVDETSSVIVRMHSGTLASITQAALLNDGNTAILGNEVLQFKRAELVGADTYRLSGFLRARKGTEQHVGTHAVNDRFILFTPSTIYRLVGTLAELNTPELWKGVTTGQTLDEAIAIPFTNTGAGLKPLAPVHLHAVDVGGGQRLARWVRRTRLGGKWRDGVDVPLGEATEAYEVELVNGTGAVANRASMAVPQWQISGALAPSYELGRTDNEIRLVAGLLFGVRAAQNAFAGAIDAFNPTTGAVVGDHFIGEQTTQLADDGAHLFVSTINGANPSYVYRFIAAAPLLTPTHTYSGSANADCQGVAFDGTNVWISEFYTGRIRKLAAADLSVVASYALSTPGRMVVASGALWVLTGDAVTKVDVATGGVLLTITAPSAGDLTVSGGFVYAWSDSFLKSFNATTGALVASEPIAAARPRSARLTLFDGYAITADLSTSELVFFDLATGLFAKRVFIDKLRGVSGTDSTRLFIEVDVPPLGVGYATRAYLASDFTGFTLRVYQLSSTVGRGFPATLQL